MASQQNRMSPRQKMINLMYVVLMAMLALNVSSDVLNGFSLVEDSLLRTTANASASNEALYKDLQGQMEANPAKVKEWFDKAQYVKKISDSLYNYAEALKVSIVKQADGEDGDVKDVQNKEDLEAASHVMLAPRRGEGQRLFAAINSFRESIVGMLTDETQKKIIADNLSTEVPNKAGTLGKNWQEYMFENTPVAAAVTLLSKLQSDVRYAEGEVLHALVANIDMKDLRVNELNAFVIPASRTVVQGGKFSAQIIMAAVDTTQRPTVYVNGRQITSPGGLYETVCSSTGDYTLKGYIEMMDGRGQMVRRDFSQPYTVVAPSATVSADLMNVLYAGIANPIRIAVPGVPSGNVTATMTNGTLVRKGDQWEARPTTVGTDAIISVHAKMADGRSVEMAKTTFRVRALPDPMPFIEYKDQNGNMRKFRGGQFSKRNLVEADGIQAAIDDDLLNVPFKVLSFELTFYDSMGNIIPEVTQGNQFSQRQKDYIRRLARGKRFYITHVKVLGPDNKERIIPTVEVIVN